MTRTRSDRCHTTTGTPVIFESVFRAQQNTGDESPDPFILAGHLAGQYALLDYSVLAFLDTYPTVCSVCSVGFPEADILMNRPMDNTHGVGIYME